MTEIYLHIDARMADYIRTHPYSYRLPWPGISFREDYALSAAPIQGYRSAALGGSGTQYYPLTRAEARERSKAGAQDQARTCGVTVARL